MDQPIWLTFIVAFIFMNVLLVGMAYMTWYERKVLAAMQDRVGPNRTGPKGLLAAHCRRHQAARQGRPHPGPCRQSGFLFRAARGLRCRDHSGGGDPFGNTITVFGHPVNLWVTDLNVGALFLLAFGSLGVYGIILGGYASANRYSLLGGLRSAAQVVSYEIVLGLSLVGIFLISSSLSIRTIMELQMKDLSFALGLAHLDASQLVHPLSAARLRDFLHRRGRGNEPGPV